MAVVSDYSQLSPGEVYDLVSSLQSEMVGLQSSRDTLRLQLDGLSKPKSKANRKPKPSNGPEDPDDDDDHDEGDDHDPEMPRLPMDEHPDMSFGVLVKHNDHNLIFKMGKGDRSVEELKFAISARLEIEWYNMVLWPFGAEEPLDDDVIIYEPLLRLGGDVGPFATFHIGYDLEVTDDFPPWMRLTTVNVIEQFGDRRTFALNMFTGTNAEHVLDCITCYLVEKTCIPFWAIKLNGNDDSPVWSSQSVVVVAL